MRTMGANWNKQRSLDPIIHSSAITSSSKQTVAEAVVVGICAHGLSVVRSLWSGGVRVHVLENNMKLPGTLTKMANVHFARDINGAALVDVLLETSDRINAAEKPILFLTNDNMVAEVAKHWDRLEGSYELSWQDCRKTIASLLVKSALEERCVKAGLNYPSTYKLASLRDLELARSELEFPVIVKPEKPLGRFKTRRISSFDGLVKLAQSYSSDLPFLVQQWIVGGDEKLFFCALYLDRGKVLARFDGRKLLSHPPAMGQTTVAEAFISDAVYESTKCFFDGLSLSGPVSLELKEDESGRLWVIEPTVGRTDYWLPVCNANGVNFRYIEYRHVIGSPLTSKPQKVRARWFDTERDLVCYVKFLLGNPLKIVDKAVFPYLYWRDLRPFIHAAFISSRKIIVKVWSNLRQLTRAADA